MKNIHTVGTVPKSNRKIVERGKIDTLNTQIYDRSLYWLGTGISIKSGRVKISFFRKISWLFEFQWHSIIIFRNQSSQTFPEIQFVRICFVFRMYVLHMFVRDSKLSFSKCKTDIDSSRSWRQTRGKPIKQ